MRTQPVLVRPVSTHPKDAGSAKERTHGTQRTLRTNNIPPQFCWLEGQAVTALDGVPEDPGRMDEGHLP